MINCNDLPACHSEGDAVVFIDDDTDNVAADDIETLREKVQKEAGNSMGVNRHKLIEFRS